MALRPWNGRIWTAALPTSTKTVPVASRPTMITLFRPQRVCNIANLMTTRHRHPIHLCSGGSDTKGPLRSSRESEQSGGINSRTASQYHPTLPGFNIPDLISHSRSTVDASKSHFLYRDGGAKAFRGLSLAKNSAKQRLLCFSKAHGSSKPSTPRESRYSCTRCTGTSS